MTWKIINRTLSVVGVAGRKIGVGREGLFQPKEFENQAYANGLHRMINSGVVQVFNEYGEKLVQVVPWTKFESTDPEPRFSPKGLEDLDPSEVVSRFSTDENGETVKHTISQASLESTLSSGKEADRGEGVQTPLSEEDKVVIKKLLDSSEVKILEPSEETQPQPIIPSEDLIEELDDEDEDDLEEED